MWDGIFPLIAARQTPLNLRFALPGGAAALYEPGSEPVGGGASTPTRRAAAGRRACSIAAARRTPARRSSRRSARPSSGACACRRAWSAPTRQRDIPLPDNVRRYYIPGTHARRRPRRIRASPADRQRRLRAAAESQPDGRYDARADAPRSSTGSCADTPPPPSRYPTLASRRPGRRRRARRSGFPAIPGAAVRRSTRQRRCSTTTSARRSSTTICPASITPSAAARSCR